MMVLQKGSENILMKGFGWKTVTDLGDISGARGLEMNIAVMGSHLRCETIREF